MAQPKSLYDRDFLVWSQEQAAALRAASRDGSNQRLDWAIVRHLLKLEHSPAEEPRRGWAESVVDARAEIEDLLEASPSLRTGLDRDLERQTQRGIDLALRDLGRYREIDAATVARLRATVYTEAQVLGDWFPGERR